MAHGLPSCGEWAGLLHSLWNLSSQSESEVAQICLTLCDPMDCSLHQASPSMGFSRQEYWGGSPFPSSGNLSDPGIEPGSPALQADALPSVPPEKLSSQSGIKPRYPVSPGGFLTTGPPGKSVSALLI